jgi:hypothetical protein
VEAIFKVNWRQMFISTSVFMTTAVTTPLLIFAGIQLFAKHRPPAFVLPLIARILLIVVPPLIAFALLISQWFRLATITISDGAVKGRSYLGFKKKIPLTDITKLTQFHSNGIRAFVLHSKYHGKIYIYDRTERLGELMALLMPYLKAEENKTIARP